MPNRIIRDSVKTSPTLAQVSDSAERLFYRLTVEADDYGRFEADPRVVQGACVPLLGWSLAKVRMCMQMLADAGLVQLYRVNGRVYGVFSTFERHQGKPRAARSKYPDPVDCEQMFADVLKCSQMSPVSESESENRIRESYSSLKRPPADGEVAVRFQGFWQTYPARNGKKLEKAFTESLFRKLSVQDQALAATAARNYAEALKAQGISAKDPKRFLRNGQGHEPWRDWIEPARSESAQRLEAWLHDES